MTGRNLKLLLINDQDVGIGTDHLDVWEGPSGFNGDISRLAHWPQHMFLWGNGRVPEFDLLLIDIKFEQDTYDPYYFGEKESKGEGAINPFGLLHALPLAARQDLTNMPFVWGIHSGDPSAVKDDPVAIWAFGLLCAMERREGWDGYSDTRQIPQYFSSKIGSLPALPAEDAWRDLLGRYRDRLKERCLRENKLYVDPENLNQLVSSFETAEATEFSNLANATLFLYSGNDTDPILIRSLFADFDQWDLKIKKDILAFLGSPFFCPGDLEDLSSLMIKLRASADPFSKYVGDRLSEETKHLLAEFDDATEPNPRLVDSIVYDFNNLLKGESLFDAQRFVQITLSEETRKLTEYPQGQLRSHLNRQLLEEAYPHEIARRKYSDGLLAAVRKQEAVYTQVRDTVSKLRDDPNGEVKLSDVLPASDERNTIAVGVIICLWLLKLFEGEDRKGIDMLIDLGYYAADADKEQKPNYVSVNRFLKYVGIRSPLVGFLSSLESEEIRNPALRECARRYWQEVLDPDQDKKWPTCLGSEP